MACIICYEYLCNSIIYTFKISVNISIHLLQRVKVADGRERFIGGVLCLVITRHVRRERFTTKLHYVSDGVSVGPAATGARVSWHNYDQRTLYVRHHSIVWFEIILLRLLLTCSAHTFTHIEEAYTWLTRYGDLYTVPRPAPDAERWSENYHSPI